jgi:histidyl-tRNA synthetase
MIQRIKGTQDFLDLSLLQFITNNMTEHLNLHNFNQIELPIIEAVDVFKRTVGTDTDIVNKEMFVITPREGSKELICLRPEATAATMRAFLENGIQILPWKVFSFGAMFRYERPQKGRYRQFHQANIEIIGANSIHHDIALITMLDSLFRDKLQIPNYALVINFLGCPQDRINFRKELQIFLQSNNNICPTCQTRATTNPLRVFDCKNEACQKIYLQAPKITGSLCTTCKDEWQDVQTNLELLSVSFAVKPNLVRGLDYYNKTVFEFVSNDLGAQSSFCGGGRYELATQLGSKKEVPSIGAAIGLERIMIMLEGIQDKLPIAKKPALSVVIPLDEAQHTLAHLVMQNLYQNKICAEILLEGSVKSKMRKANKLGASFCILIGENEQATHSATIKNMLTGAEELVKQVDIAKALKK